MSVAMSRGSLGLALSLRIHLLNNSSAHDGRRHRLLRPTHLFDETARPITHSPSLCGDLDELFYTVCQLIAAFEIQSEPEILVQATILLERFIRRAPDLFTTSTVRPLLLTSLMVSTKWCIDEVVTGSVAELHRVGFIQLDQGRLNAFEAMFLQAIDWQVAVSRQVYSVYAFELAALALSQFRPLRAVAPKLVACAEALDAPASDAARDQRGERSITPLPPFSARKTVLAMHGSPLAACRQLSLA